MRKVAAFLMLSLYLCSTTESYQLLKLPAFISHFITHCSNEPSTTLSGFLSEHYSGEIVFDDDWQDDMKLPFKTCDHESISVQITLKSEPIALIEPVVFEKILIYTPKLPNLTSTLQVCDIFQPPRFIA